jgi:CheY-like chemotaxis protein
MSDVATAEDCVLIVDDEPDIRETLRDVVEMGGCSVIVACNGVEALQVLERHRPCLVIIDLLMPVMDGVQLLETMQRTVALASIPVLISTSAPERAPAGVPVLPKPINIAKLWEWMRANCACSNTPDSG